MKRLCEVIVGAALHGLDGRLHAAVRGQQQHFHLRLGCLELLEQLDAAHPRQVQVEQGHVEAVLVQERHGLLGAGGVDQIQALALETLDQSLPQLLVVIDNQQPNRIHRRA